MTLRSFLGQLVNVYFNFFSLFFFAITAPHQQEYGHAMHSKNKGYFDNSLNPGVTALPISELPFEVLLHRGQLRV